MYCKQHCNTHYHKVTFKLSAGLSETLCTHAKHILVAVSCHLTTHWQHGLCHQTRLHCVWCMHRSVGWTPTTCMQHALLARLQLNLSQAQKTAHQQLTQTLMSHGWTWVSLRQLLISRTFQTGPSDGIPSQKGPGHVLASHLPT